MEDGAVGAEAPNKDKAATTTGELGEKIKKIEMKPPPPGTTLGLLAKNTALLPSSIVRVKQLDNASLKPVPSIGSSGSATGNPRNKTALAPGHSLMDWIRLGSSGVDLTGVGGRLLTVTPAELAKHNKPDDAWIAIRGQVFNITRYLSFHPGGIPELMKGAGKDATKLFDDVHAWVNYQSILQKCLVGRLERSVNLELYFGSGEAKPDKSTAKSESRAKEPSCSGVKTDWRQTTGTVSLLYTTLSEDAGGECQLRKLTESELGLTIRLEKSGRVARHAVKLAGDVQWPPNCKSTSQPAETEIVFKKKERGIWKTYGSLRASDEEADPTERTYTEYELLENTPLCELVHLLVLRSRDYMQIVPPGRHVEVKMDVMGTEVSRAYTPVPSWLHPSEATGASDDRLFLMVKRYEDGALSPKLTRLRPGDSLQLSGALGQFRAEAFDGYDTIHMLAAGTGLTPMLGLIKRALGRRSPPSINLINFNRNEQSIFYGQQLELVAGERGLKVTHVLSEAGGTWSGRTGGATEQLLNDLMGERSARACVFTCGPPGFIKLAAQSLRSLGWEPSQTHEFDG